MSIPLLSLASLLGLFDRGSVRLWAGSLTRKALKHPARGLERSGEVTLGLLVPKVEFGGVGLEGALETHDGLNEERLSVLHVTVLKCKKLAWDKIKTVLDVTHEESHDCDTLGGIVSDERGYRT